MKTIKLIGALIVAIISCVIFSDCSSDPIVPEITVEMGNENYFTKNMDFDSSVGEKTFSFNSNVDWTIDVAATRNGTTWCTVTPNSGKAGANTVRIKVQENTGYDDRNVVLTLTAGSTLTKTITVTQKQKDALLLTTNKFEVEPQGGKINIEVKANVEYEVIVPETCKSWISQGSKSRGLTTSTVTFDIAETEEYDKREGEIIIKSGDLSETVHVYQTGQEILLLTKNEYPVSDKGETIAVEVKSNFAFDVQMPNVDWVVDASKSRGVSSHTLYYTILPNETYDCREAEIIFYDKNSSIKDTLKIIQAQKDAIILNEKNYEVNAEGKTIEVKLSANVEFEVTMPEVDWISQETSRALIEHTLYFKIDKNTGENDRTAEIVFKDKQSELSEKIVVTQKCPVGYYADGIVTIKVPGNMKYLLGNDYLNITSLKVVGPINGDDVCSLRKMLGGSEFNDTEKGKLTTLDLSDASIVKGGEWYYKNGYYTSSDEIGVNMFYECTNLQTMVLPIGTTLIGSSAFAYCSSLTSINIPDGVTSVGNWAFQGCSSLTSVYITDITAWCNITFDDLYSNPLNEGAKLYLNNNELTELIIPLEIKQIKDHAFYCCKSLQKVTMGANVTSIGGLAFGYCSSLTSINIPDGVTSIGGSAFRECSSLTSINIPDGVTLIGYGVFEGCSSLTSINIPDGLTSIGNFAFQGCSSLTSINIPNGLTSVGNFAFQGCYTLKSVHITDLSAWCNITFKDSNSNPLNNGAKLYLNNDELIELVIPTDVKQIKDYTFHGYKSIKKVTIGKDLNSIGISSFGNCSSLTQVYCHCTTPPAINSSSTNSSFNGASSGKTLYVPVGYNSAYQSSDWAGFFGTIKEMD